MKILLIGGELDGDRVDFDEHRLQVGTLTRYRVPMAFELRRFTDLPTPVNRSAEYVVHSFYAENATVYYGLALGMSPKDAINALISNYPNFAERKFK